MPTSNGSKSSYSNGNQFRCYNMTDAGEIDTTTASTIEITEKPIFFELAEATSTTPPPPTSSDVSKVAPMSFTYFNAECVNQSSSGNVRLSWGTANDQNITKFNVMRTEDNKTWELVGSVSPNTSNYYIYFDNATKAYNYKGVAFDKENLQTSSYTAYANCVTIINNVSVYPNPFRNAINTKFTADIGTTAMLAIYSETGVLIKAKQIQAIPGANSFTLNVGNVPRGKYTFSISYGIQKYSTTLLKQ
jgi:hypothetical protein